MSHLLEVRCCAKCKHPLESTLCTYGCEDDDRCWAQRGQILIRTYQLIGERLERVGAADTEAQEASYGGASDGSAAASSDDA